MFVSDISRGAERLAPLARWMSMPHLGEYLGEYLGALVALKVGDLQSHRVECLLLRRDFRVGHQRLGLRRPAANTGAGMNA